MILNTWCVNRSQCCNFSVAVKSPFIILSQPLGSSASLLMDSGDSVIRSESSIMMVGKIVCLDFWIIDWDVWTRSYYSVLGTWLGLSRWLFMNNTWSTSVSPIAIIQAHLLPLTPSCETKSQFTNCVLKF